MKRIWVEREKEEKIRRKNKKKKQTESTERYVDLWGGRQKTLVVGQQERMKVYGN